MTLDDEYLECVKNYTIIPEETVVLLFENLWSKFHFHTGGRIDTAKSNNYIELFSIDELKEYFKSKNISLNEQVTLLPSISDTPTLKTSLSSFFRCFDDCIAACSDVWILFDNYDLVIEINHDDQIFVFNS